MKDGWEMKKLGEICVVERGSSPRPIKKFITQDSDGVNWIKIGDVDKSEKYVTKTKQKITKEGAKKSRFVNIGDFILSNSMSFGRPYIMRIPGYIHDGWFVLRLPKNLNSDYFWYLLSSPLLKDQFNSLAAGAIVKNISGDLVKKAELPIPPLPEQKKIVTLLDTAFAKIDQAQANIEKNIANAQELLDSILEHIFSGVVSEKNKCSLNSICELIVDCEHKTAPTQEEGFPSIRTPNIGKGYLILDGVYRVSKETYLKWSKRAIPQSGDLIMAREAPAGNVGIIPENLKVCLGQRTLLIRPIKSISRPQFLAYYLLTSSIQKILLSKTRGTTVGHVNMKDIRNLPIGEFPNLEIQANIEEKVNLAFSKSKELEDTFQKKLKSINDLKKSLLQKAFTGELTT